MVGAIITTLLYKSGLLKKRGRSPDVAAGGSAPTLTQYPVAGLSLANVAPRHEHDSRAAASSGGQLPTAVVQYPELT